MIYTYGEFSDTAKEGLCGQLGISYNSVFKRIQNGDSFFQAVEHLVNRKNFRTNLLIKANKLFSTEFTKLSDVEKHLNKLKVKRSTGKMLPIDERLTLYSKFINTACEFLILPKKEFNYKGILFTSVYKFTVHHKLFITKLYEELFINGFNVDKAVKKCSNDPDYKKYLKPVIEGIPYKSVKHLATNKNINYAGYLQRVRDSSTIEEALEEELKRKTYNTRFDPQFPITVNNHSCLDMKELAEQLNINRATLLSYLSSYDYITDFLAKYNPRPYYFGEFKTRKELCESYGITLNIYRSYLRENGNNVQSTVYFMESIKFEYDGKILLPVREQVRIYGISKPIKLKVLRELLLSADTILKKNLVAAKFIEHENANRLNKIT